MAAGDDVVAVYAAVAMDAVFDFVVVAMDVVSVFVVSHMFGALGLGCPESPARYAASSVWLLT